MSWTASLGAGGFFVGFMVLSAERVVKSWEASVKSAEKFVVFGKADEVRGTGGEVLGSVCKVRVEAQFRHNSRIVPNTA